MVVDLMSCKICRAGNETRCCTGKRRMWQQHVLEHGARRCSGEDMMGVLSTLQTRVVRACVILATGGIKASDGSNSAQKSTVYPPPSDIPSPSSCQHVRPPRPQQCLGLQQSVSSPSHSRYPLISLQDRSLSLSEKSYWSQIRIRPQSPSKSKQQHPRSVRPSPSRSVL